MAYKSNSNKFWTGFLAVLLALVLAGTAALVGVLSDGFKNWDKFKTDEEQTEETADNGAPVTDENGNELDSNAVIPMAKAMTFRSAMSLDGRNAAYDSVTVNATVEPSDVELKSFTFTAEWVNPASEWATGKDVSDYFTVTQSGTNSLQATLQCLQPFGEQIKVIGTGTSLDDITASAECTIDFAKRIVSATISGSNIESVKDGVKLTSSSGLFNATDILSSCSFTYSAYTVEDTFTTLIGAEGNTVLENALTSGGVTGVSHFSFVPSVENYGFATNGSSLFYLFLVGCDLSMYKLGTEQSSVAKTIAAEHCNDMAMYYIVVSAEGTYSTFETQIPVYMEESDFFSSIENVTLDQDNVII